MRILQSFIVGLSCCVLISLSCSAPEKWDTYPQFIRATASQDEKYLQEFKREHELNWGNDWKFMSSEIDPHMHTVEIVGQGTTTQADTSCLVQWNQRAGNEGVIRREGYSDEKKWPSIECFYFRGDSVYAWGTIHHIVDDRQEKLVITQHYSRPYFCSNCASKSYNTVLQELAGDTLNHAVVNYEYAFYDGQGELSGKYLASELTAWSFGCGASGVSATLTSDTTITTVQPSPFVTINAPRK